MLDRSLPLARPFGIEVRVHWTWMILALLVASSLATGFFPYVVPGFAASIYWTAGVFGAIGLFLSILIHEFCHAIVGRAYRMPMNRITLFLFGGVAHMEDEPPSPGAEFQMAIAGPLASLVLAITFYGLYSAAFSYGANPLLQALLSYLASVNVVVAVFNMLPGYPLDGGRVLRSALWKFKKDLVWATKYASYAGQGFGIGLAFFGFVSLFVGQGLSGIWSIVLGFLLMMFARASYLQLVVRKALHGKPAANFMNAAPMIVAPETSVSELLRESLQRDDQMVYPVIAHRSDEDVFIGCVDVREARRFPENEWAAHQVSEIVQECPLEMQIAPDTDAETALERMSKSGRRELIVVQGRRLMGVLTQNSLIRYLQVQGPLRAT